MKKTVLTLALCAAVSAGAQVVNVGGIERVNLPEDAATQVAAVSPAGDYLLLSTDTHQGLTKLDLATGERTVITNAPGAGYNVRISDDGNNIVYRQTSINDKKLRQTAVQNYNVATRATEQLVKPTRDMKKVQASALKKATMAYATQNYELMVNVDGKARQLTPLGAGKRYIWVSLSPNGEKVLFFVSGDAAYVCNIDGTGLQKLGMLHAAKWLDDNIVVGMNDKDNGEVYTSSEIVAVNLQGQRQVLTGNDMIAMFPQCGGDKIAFTTDAGEVYMINLTK
ncbi:MAG: hypothetical protein IKS64_03545 [Muribaculaceae bacterium]|nr:hypothetical protein [Muribaculaceae bacterium]MBR6431904.1 hypothetical protein [Muribaculaceae bacterium]